MDTSLTDNNARLRALLQAEAYGGYNALYEGGRITEAACMAHGRRKIHEVHARIPTDITTEALKRSGSALPALELTAPGCRQTPADFG